MFSFFLKEKMQETSNERTLLSRESMDRLICLSASPLARTKDCPCDWYELY